MTFGKIELIGQSIKMIGATAPSPMTKSQNDLASGPVSNIQAATADAFSRPANRGTSNSR